MQKYLLVWFIVTAYLIYEFWALSYSPERSLLVLAQGRQWLDPSIKFSVQPGRTLSLWLGWIGLSLMIIMNVYSLRKRISFLSGVGNLKGWLNFHIFCGLLGSTLIFFHCGFKARGIVGISFWSMVVSLTSGIIGRYFFTQLGAKQSDYEKYAQRALAALDQKFSEWKIKDEPETREKVFKLALDYVGAVPEEDEGKLGATMVKSMLGDLRILLMDISVPTKWPKRAKDYVFSYAINVRKAKSLAVFQRLMGYWHAFHFPFAIFMYVAAAIHVAASMIFLGMLG